MAQDLQFKRQAIARNFCNHARNLIVAINGLQDAKVEISQLASGFVQDDFDDNTDLAHLDPGMLGYLTDFVIPNFIDEYMNGAYNKEILNKVRAA
jgi:hypothetical protein